MGNPVKPSEVCDTVPSPTASICDKLKQFFNIAKILCRFWEWAWDENGNPTEAFRASFVGIGAPVGGVLWYPLNSVPNGWLICNGQSVSRTSYAALFAIYGTTYGAGDGTTTFGVPDLRGLFLFGASGSHAVAETGGTETVALTAEQNGAHTHTTLISTDNFTSSGSDPCYRKFASPPYGTESRESSSSGSGTAHNNMPPFRVGLWICKT